MDKRLEKTILEDYLRDYSLEQGLSGATVRSKKGSLKRFIAWLGEKPFNSDTCREWARSLHEKGLKPESIKHEVRVIRATVRFLYKRGLIDKNFASEIPSPKVPRKILEIVPAEVAERIIIAGTEPGKGDNCLNTDRKMEHRQALRFVLRTGLRSRELIDLRGQDVNLEEETYFVKSKSGNIDVLPLPKDMLKDLTDRKNKARLFEVTRETLNKSMKRGCERLGITKRIRTHTLRHIFCTSLLKRGVPMQIVTRLMRHATITLTDSVYSHYQIDDLRLALNSKHPLIFQGIGVKNTFDLILDLIRSTEVQNDKRYITKITRGQKRLILEVWLKN